MELRKTSFKPGKYKVTDTEYHADPSISSTQLVEACRSPAHFWAISSMNPERQQRPDTDALSFGRAIHSSILEPEVFDRQYVVIPEDAPRKPTKAQLNAVKKSEAAYRSIDYWTDFNERVAVENLSVVSFEDRELIKGMGSSLASQELETDSGKVFKLADIFKAGEAEQAFFWKDPETGLACRCKADWVIGNIVLDYKSTKDAQLHQFRRQVGGLRYHMRAAFYIDGITAVTGKAPSRFILLAQEKTFPFCAAPYQLLDSDIDQGRREYQRALRAIAASIEKGRFDGYSRKVQELSIPDYLYDNQ